MFVKHREALISKMYPELSDEARTQFCHEFANVCFAATCVNGGQVVESDQPEAMYAMAFFLNWKWRQNLLIEVAKKQGNPEPEFVEFVHKVVVSLNLIPYIDNEVAKKEFEAVMAGRCSLTRTTDGRFAFGTQIAYEAWLRAHNRGTPHGK
jgi:hypothetical protein